jgi:hypothetical protein
MAEDLVRQLRSLSTGLISVDAMWEAVRLAQWAANEIEHLRAELRKAEKPAK